MEFILNRPLSIINKHLKIFFSCGFYFPLDYFLCYQLQATGVQAAQLMGGFLFADPPATG